MTTIDLFAGIGGWDLAARDLGIDPLGVEIWEPACLTRDAAGLRTLRGSVRDVEIPRDLAGLIASPPCQTFSAAGSGAGRKALDTVLEGVWRLGNGAAEAFTDGEIEDERTRLVLEPLRWVLQGRPEWTAWEQVPTVLPVWKACAEVLRAHGYSVWVGNLHSEQYGVPQTRKRAFLLASRTPHVTAPVATHSRYYPRNKAKLDEGVLPWVSMAQALGWGATARPSMTVTGGGAATGGAEPFGNAVRERDSGRWVHERPSPTEVHTGDDGEGSPTFQRNHDHIRDGETPPVLVNNNTPNACRRSADEPSGTIYTGHRINDIRWVHERPSPTIVGSFRPDVVAAPGWRKAGDGPRQNTPGSVRVTVEEVLVLQGFPADYPLQGSKTSQYLQVGNAVPPPMARAALLAAGATSHNETKEEVA